MKNVVLVVVALMALILAGCGNSNNSQPTNTAVVPNACGQGIPAGYCTSYNPYANPYSPYGVSGYGYGGYSGYGGYYYPGSYGIPGSYGNYGVYGYGAYGCPTGYAPVYNFGSYTCVSVTSMSGVYGYGGFGYGYGIYYPSNYTWPNGATGLGPAYSCDAYSNNCPSGSLCIAAAGTRYGYCSVKTGP